MKKMIIALLTIFSLGSYANAQWHLTPEIGLTTVKRNGFGDSWNAGIKAGISLEYILKSDHFSFKSGLYYANRGYSFNPQFDGNSLEELPIQTKLNRNFLQLPIMMNYYCPLNREVSLFFAAGPYVGISLKDNWTGGYIVNTQDYFIQDLNAFDWGLSALIGLEINKKWIMQLGYDLSLGEESKNDGLNANYHTISLSVGYKF